MSDKSMILRKLGEY